MSKCEKELNLDEILVFKKEIQGLDCKGAHILVGKNAFYGFMKSSNHYKNSSILGKMIMRFQAWKYFLKHSHYQGEI